jgi:hypothetical protein
MKAWVIALALCVKRLARSSAVPHLQQLVGFDDSTVDSGWYRNLAFPTGNAQRKRGWYR